MVCYLINRLIDLVQYQYQHQDQHHQQHNNNESVNNTNDVLHSKIHSTSKIWLAGPKRKSTVQLPDGLAEKYGMNQPCRIAFYDNGNGIKMKFVHINHHYNNHDDNDD
jgi:hypothetical protein